MNLFSFGNEGVRVVKGFVGILLLISAFLFSLYIAARLIKDFLENPSHAVILFLSDVLMVLIFLELAKTIFSFLENDERYLHSIMETAFIAVLREVILLEIKGLSLSTGIALAVLIFVIGFVYYKMYRSKEA